MNVWLTFRRGANIFVSFLDFHRIRYVNTIASCIICPPSNVDWRSDNGPTQVQNLVNNNNHNRQQQLFNLVRNIDI